MNRNRLALLCGLGFILGGSMGYAAGARLIRPLFRPRPEAPAYVIPSPATGDAPTGLPTDWASRR